jgi:1,4-alpha-glucan branching enzyme
MTFVFIAPHATKVSVVGDFNQWNAEAAPMSRDRDTGVWTVSLPIAAGRHLYSFLSVGADGERWVADPYAPAAPDDGFGRVNSVVLVGKGSL